MARGKAYHVHITCGLVVDDLGDRGRVWLDFTLYYLSVGILARYRFGSFYIL